MVEGLTCFRVDIRPILVTVKKNPGLRLGFFLFAKQCVKIRPMIVSW